MSSIFCEYFDWLYDLSGLKNVNGYSYKSLADVMNCKTFVSLVDHDENRVADGLALREDFMQDTQLSFMDFDDGDELNDFIESDSCSALEIIIALAKRMDFEVRDTYEPVNRVPEFVFVMLSNLGLDIYDDDSETNYAEIDEILNNWINRTYDYSGEGGLFPLYEPEEDQRTIELWVQMMNYLREEEYV